MITSGLPAVRLAKQNALARLNALPPVKALPRLNVPPRAVRTARIVTVIALGWAVIAGSATLFTTMAEGIVPYSLQQWLLELALRFLAILPGLVLVPYGVSRLVKSFNKR